MSTTQELLAAKERYDSLAAEIRDYAERLKDTGDRVAGVVAQILLDIVENS